MADRKRNVGIVIFDGVEVLDFAGPYEVFSVAGEVSDPGAFNVYLIAESKEAVAGRNDFRVVPHHTFAQCPKCDILLIPGGPGTRIEENRPEMVDWVADSFHKRMTSPSGGLENCWSSRLQSKNVRSCRSQSLHF